MRVMGGPVSGGGTKGFTFRRDPDDFRNWLVSVKGYFLVSLQTLCFLSSDFGVNHLYASFLTPPLSLKKILLTA